MIRFLLSRVAGESRREVARDEGRRTRRLAPRIEGLEGRELLSAMWASPTVGSGGGSGSIHNPPPEPHAMTLAPVPGSGRGRGPPGFIGWSSPADSRGG